MPFPQRTLAAVFATAAILAIPAQAHAAPTYPPGGGNSITVDTTSPTVGQTITVSAQTFAAGSDVDVTTVVEGSSGTATTSLGAPGSSTGSGRVGTGLPLAAATGCQTGTTCTVVANADGLATASVTLTKAGSTNITFAGKGADGKTLTQTVAVTAVASTAGQAAPAPGTGLASTGPHDLFQTLGVALGMLAFGAVLVLVVRRRRDTLTTA